MTKQEAYDRAWNFGYNHNLINLLEEVGLLKFDTKEMPVFEHHHAGRHFKIYENGAVLISVSNLGYDSNLVINRLDKIK